MPEILASVAEQVTALQAANRMLFNQAEDEFLDGDEVVGMGTLGKEGSGRLRMQVSQRLSGASSPTGAEVLEGHIRIHTPHVFAAVGRCCCVALKLCKLSTLWKPVLMKYAHAKTEHRD